MRSAARVLGTAKVRTSSSRPTARTPSNHRPQVFGASWERRAVAPCSQISAAVTPRSNSTGASTGVEKVPLGGHRRRPRAGGQVRPRVRGSSPLEAVTLARRPNVAPAFRGEQGFASTRRAPRRPALRLFHAPPYTRWFARLLQPPTPGSRANLREEAMREAHVSAEQPEAQEASRLPSPHAEPGRSGGAQGPAPARPHAPLGLIGRVRDRATFAALAGAERQVRGPIAVRFVPGDAGAPPRVAYAVSGARNAVARNRLRRRLR